MLRLIARIAYLAGWPALFALTLGTVLLGYDPRVPLGLFGVMVLFPVCDAIAPEIRDAIRQYRRGGR